MLPSFVAALRTLRLTVARVPLPPTLEEEPCELTEEELDATDDELELEVATDDELELEETTEDELLIDELLLRDELLLSDELVEDIAELLELELLCTVKHCSPNLVRIKQFTRAAVNLSSNVSRDCSRILAKNASIVGVIPSDAMKFSRSA